MIAPSLTTSELLTEDRPPWSLPHRLFFRFVCIYFFVYSLPNTGHVSIFNEIPGTQAVWKPYGDLWRAICPWVGSHWFHLSGRPITYTPTGSGDTTLDYIQNLLFILTALAGAAIWSILGRKRGDYRALDSWLRIVVRYTLAFTLFGYGFAKIFPLQFRAPGFARLIEPYGDFSPMGALWYFMGASTAYIIFSGVAEVVPGLLLLFRRTTTLGALGAFAVLLNVAVLNYCYDVPVKLYSTNLVLMALYLAAGDLRRLLSIFLLNRPTNPIDHSAPTFSDRRLRVGAIVFQVLFVGYTLISTPYNLWQSYQKTSLHPQRPPIYGLYDVEQFKLNGKDVPRLETDPTRWRKVLAEGPSNIIIKMIDGKTKGYPVVYDDAKKTLTVRDPRDNKTYALTYSRPDPTHLNLDGTIAGDQISAVLTPVDVSKFLLVSRGFHWINELPFNR